MTLPLKTYGRRHPIEMMIRSFIKMLTPKRGYKACWVFARAHQVQLERM